MSAQSLFSQGASLPIIARLPIDLRQLCQVRRFTSLQLFRQRNGLAIFSAANQRFDFCFERVLPLAGFGASPGTEWTEQGGEESGNRGRSRCNHEDGPRPRIEVARGVSTQIAP